MEVIIIQSIRKTLEGWVFNNDIKVPYQMLPSSYKNIFRSCTISFDAPNMPPKLFHPRSPAHAAPFLSDFKNYALKYFQKENIPAILLDNFIKSHVIPEFPMDPSAALSKLQTKDTLSNSTRLILLTILSEMKDDYNAQNTFANLVHDLYLKTKQAPTTTHINALRNLSRKIEGIDEFRKNPYVHSHNAPLDLVDTLSSDLFIHKRTVGTLVYLLRKHLDMDGHTCYPEIQLVKEAAHQTSHSDMKGVKSLFNTALEDDKFTLIEDADGNRYVYLSSVYYKEEYIANKLVALKTQSSRREPEDVIKPFVHSFEAENNTKLSLEQVTAITQIFTSTDVLVITGYPGTGKSTITKCIKDIYERLYNTTNDEILFAAPTGIASTKLNNGKGMTLHRALQAMVSKNGKFVFQKGATNPFSNQLIIIDEFSMVDVDLAYHLLDAIVPGHTKLVIIGDHNQLPSVGPGDILRHIIESASIPVIKLTKIFRQTLTDSINHIFEFAKLVNRGKMPSNDQVNNDKITFYNIGDEEEIYQAVIKLFTKHNQNCQILFGTKKETTVGSIRGNKVIAAHIHPPTDSKTDNIGCFMKGDKVVCTKNCVAIGDDGEIVAASSIYNGEIGIISGIDKVTNRLKFSSGNKAINVSADILEHGWCITVNKSQGSEYDTVVVVLHPSQSVMLNRQVLYTAATRAKKKLYIIGTPATLKKAITSEASRRYSLLSSIIASIEP